MRDIRADLRERLTELKSREIELKEELEATSNSVIWLELLLEEEDARWPEVSKSGSAQFKENGHASPLRDLILETLADGMVRTNEDLILIATDRGIPFGAKSPARTVNCALLGLKKGKKVERVAKKQWRLGKAQVPKRKRRPLAR